MTLQVRVQLAAFAPKDMKRWVRERNTDCYCPIEDDNHTVVLGMNFIGDPPGEVVGEFWFDAEGGLHVEVASDKDSSENISAG